MHWLGIGVSSKLFSEGKWAEAKKAEYRYWKGATGDQEKALPLISEYPLDGENWKILYAESEDDTGTHETCACSVPERIVAGVVGCVATAGLCRARVRVRVRM